MQTTNKKKQSDEYVFLPVKCPKCGLEGKVRISRLYSTFQCKQCHRDFYITATGAVTGERPPEVPVDPYGPVSQPKGALTRKLEQLPRSVWWLFGGLFVAGIAMALAWPLLAEPAVGVPESLDGRAQFVAEAIARADYRRLKAVVPRGKSVFVMEWARTVRPADWPAEFGADQTVAVHLETLFKNSQRGAVPDAGAEAGDDSPVATAGISTTIVPPGKVRPLSVILYWAQDSELQWTLDIARTSKEGT